uniref:Uncharacterized protein n=1 Tax=Oryza rufipogon TaxID=4529 RepID=A0A0E0Q2V7_ORYRU
MAVANQDFQGPVSSPPPSPPPRVAPSDTTRSAYSSTTVTMHGSRRSTQRNVFLQLMEAERDATINLEATSGGRDSIVEAGSKSRRALKAQLD